MTAEASGSPTTTRPRLGLDLYSLRSQGWSPFEHLDFCHAQGVEVAHFPMPSFLGGLGPENLASIRSHATERGIALEVGMGSICETSASFARGDPPAAAQLDQMLDVAHALGSPIVRCFLGSLEDREGDSAGGPLTPRSAVPLHEHIANTVATCRQVADKARALGLKVAIENHVGDLHSSELRSLVEEAGPDVVGVLLDTGNATWTLETPQTALETLAPFVVATHIRDSAVWEVPEGLAVRWCPLGEGNVSIGNLAPELGERCPGAAFSLEIINSPAPRVFAYREPAFWRPYRTIPAWTFARLADVARTGQPYLGRPRPGPAAENELEDVMDGLRYARDVLALGRREVSAG